MPTAFTHAFSGAALSLLAPRSVRGPRLALACATLAALPDLDVVGLHFGIPYAHPLGHRGFSHSIAFALLVAVLPLLVHRSRRAIGLGATCFVATASHCFLDAFTDAGLGVGFLIPLSNERFFFPWRPIRTSPLSVRAFFSEPGIEIMRNELVWVWLPVALLTGVVLTMRAGASR